MSIYQPLIDGTPFHIDMGARFKPGQGSQIVVYGEGYERVIDRHAAHQMLSAMQALGAAVEWFAADKGETAAGKAGNEGRTGRSGLLDTSSVTF